MDTNKVKICLFVDECGGTESEGNITAHRGYQMMSEWLGVYVATGSILKEIRPYQLGYRAYNIYLVDVGGYQPHVQDSFMLALGHVVRSRPSRLYLFWTGETWEAFCRVNPNFATCNNCINCCDFEATEKISRILLDMEQ